MSSQLSHSIDDDLIAAYVDGDVTAEERLQVETAMAASEQIAWEVDSLRRTVDLLREMPKAALPRSFVLAESQVEDVLHQRRARAHASPAAGIEDPPAESPWQRLLNFLGGGNQFYRNAAMAAAVLLLVVVVADFSLQQSQVGTLATGSIQPFSQTATPRIQLTAVGDSSSSSTAGVSGTAIPEEQGNGDIGVMSTRESPSDSEGEVNSSEGQAEPGSKDDKPATQATPQPAVPTVSHPPVTIDNEESVGVHSLLRSLLRSARIVLVLAIVVFWLLSRRRPRTSSA